MRYRPFAHFNLSVSAISLTLTDSEGPRTVADWAGLIDAALRLGVNCFEVQGRHPNIAAALKEALQAVERRLVTVMWRMGPHSIPEEYSARAFQPQLIQAAIKSALVRAGLAYLDVILLDDPGERDLPPQSLALLRDLKEQGVIRFIGVAGVDDAIDAYISSGAFDCLALPFNMTSGWRDRLRVRAAQEREMAVVGYDYYPAPLHPEVIKAAVKRRFWSRKPAPGQETPAYDFLTKTPQWDPEEICLAYALTEPSITTVQTPAADLKRLETLAGAAERTLPAGLAAQIEMARIRPAKDPEAQRHA